MAGPKILSGNNGEGRTDILAAILLLATGCVLMATFFPAFPCFSR